MCFWKWLTELDGEANSVGMGTVELHDGEESKGLRTQGKWRVGFSLVKKLKNCKDNCFCSEKKSSVLGISSRAILNLSFPGSLNGKESAHNVGDLGSIPGLGRSPTEGHDNSSSSLAWRIPWTQESGGLQSMSLQRVGEDSWESLGLQGDQPWDFFGRNDAKAEDRKSVV